MSLYTKNALKKIKKDALIQMFLDLQAQKVNDTMDEVVEKCCNNAIEEVIEELKAEVSEWESEYCRVESLAESLEEENKKLKEDITYTKHQKSLQNEKLKEFMDEINSLKAENKKLRKEVYTLQEGEVAHLGQIDLLKHEISKLKEKEQVKDINGKDVKVPSEAECRALFGVSKEEFIMLAKNSDCNYN